jgi:hypothetical protein
VQRTARVDARWAGRTALGAGVLLLVVGAAQAQYATAKWLAGPGAPNLSFEDRTFVDRAVGDATAAGFDYNPTSGEGVPFALNLALIFNRRFEGAVRLNGMPGTFSCCLPDVSLDIDPATGRLQASGPLPRYLVVPPGFKRADLTGRPAATSPALADYVLRDLGDAPRPSYAVTGADDDGWLAPGRPVTVRGFAAADGSPSGVRAARAAGAARGPAEYRVTGPGGVQRGSLRPGERRELRLAVSPGDAALRIRATGPAVLPDGRQRAMALTDVALDCDPATATR